MAVYWKQIVDGLGQHVEPTVEPLNPLQLMTRGPVEAVMRAQDYVAAISRRIVCAGGVGSSESWRTPDADPEDTGGTHPTPTTRRRIAAGSCDLTPGCFLKLLAVAVPSGQTQITGTTPGGAQGRIEVDVTWTDSTGTVSTTHGVQLQASAATYGAAPSVWWEGLYAYSLAEIVPTVLVNTGTLRRWCQHVHVDVEVFAVAGARVIDAVVFEDPTAVAFEADDDGEQWTSHLLGGGSPDGPGLPLTYPFQRFSETTPDGDPRGGTLHLLDVHHGQHSRLGPILFSWSGHEESTGTEYATVSSTSYSPIDGGGATTYDRTEPGVHVGTGGYARRVSANSRHVLRNRRTAIPVIVRVLASSSSGVSEVRVQTEDWSFIDVTVATGGMAWHVAAGWLEVGTTPDQERITALLARNSIGSNVLIAAVCVHKAGYVPQA